MIHLKNINVIHGVWKVRIFQLYLRTITNLRMEIIQDFNAEKRDGQRQRLMDNKVYQAMGNLTKYMDRYYLDALFGLMPGWGDLITVLSAIPFIYFSAKVIKSIPLTLAVINNSLRDVLLGMIPFFVGDIIDIFHRANTQNMKMVQGFVDGDETIIKDVNKKATQSAIVLIVMILLIILMFWALISFGKYLISFF